jgi:hypothetical protein
MALNDAFIFQSLSKIQTAVCQRSVLSSFISHNSARVSHWIFSEMDGTDKFKTPQRKRLMSMVADSPGRQITIPASPYLERLGYGTGKNLWSFPIAMFQSII